MSIYRHFNNVLGEGILGAVVESFTISASGGDEPKISFEGPAVDHGGSGQTGLLAGIEAALATALTLGAGEAVDYDPFTLVALVNPTTGAVVDDNGLHQHLTRTRFRVRDLINPEPSLLHQTNTHVLLTIPSLCQFSRPGSESKR